MTTQQLAISIAPYQLTDAERCALADLHAAPQQLSQSVFDGTNHHGRRQEALFSLKRLDLATERYDRQLIDYVYTLTSLGNDFHAALRSHMYPHCEHAVRLFCVCAEKTYCPVHTEHNGCHGSHD